MNYEILDAEGNVVNTIVADLDFVQTHYPGRFREREEVTPPAPEPAPAPAAPTKEELLAQLQALQAQITALE